MRKPTQKDKRFIPTNLVKAAAASGVACLVAFSLLCIAGAGLSGVFSGFDEHFYMKYFYDIHNNSTKAMMESPDILVIDIGDIQTRSGIAELIEKVVKCRPAVIGLDVFMKANPDMRNEADSLVLKAITNADCPVVSPCIYDETTEEWQYPFYHDLLDTVNFRYASPVAFDVNEDYTGVDPRSPCRASALELAETFSSISGCKLEKWKHRAINYRNKEFFPLNGLDPMDSELIAGKIVLLGDCRSFNDIRTLPFKIMGNNRLPSVVNIAYTVNSLLSSREYCLKHDYGFMRSIYNRPFRICTFPINFVLSYLLCFIFSLLVFSINGFVPDGKRSSKVIWLTISFIVEVGVKFILILLCINLLTAYFLIVPNILLYVTALLFIDSAITGVNILFEKE